MSAKLAQYELEKFKDDIVINKTHCLKYMNRKCVREDC